LFGVILRESGGDEYRHDAPAAPAGIRQGVAHEADATALQVAARIPETAD
jgi:hypothetical protein